MPDVYNRGFVLGLMKSCFLGGASTLVRRSVYEKVGRYDESLVRSQDYEMAVRIALRFPGVRVSGGPTYYHRVHEGLRGNLAERFPSEQRTQKWQRYNQLFVRRLCNELPIERFSPIEDDSLRSRSAELLPALERTAVRVAHEIIDDVVTDIRLLASGAFEGPVTRSERLVAEEIGRRLAVTTTLPPGFTELLRARDPRMAPVISAISRHFRLGSTWHSLPRPVRHLLRFARSAVVSTPVDV